MDRQETVQGEHLKNPLFRNAAVMTAIRQSLPALASGVAGLVFSGAAIPGGVYPFGIALLAAASGLPSATLTLLGCLIGALTTPWPLGYAVVYLSVFGGRLLIGWLLRKALAAEADTFRFLRHRKSQPLRKRDDEPGGDEAMRRILFGENVPLRVAVAVAAMLSVGIFSVVLGDEPVQNFLLSLLAAVLCPAVTAALSGVTERRFALSGEKILGEAVVAAITVYALRSFTVFGVNVGSVTAAGISLYVSWCAGAPIGSVAGFLCGIMLEPVSAPAYAAAAIAAGVLWKISPILASAGGCLAGSTFAIWAFRLDGLRATVPGLLIAAAVIGPLVRSGAMPRLRILPETIPEESGAAEAALVESARRERYRMTVTELSDSLRSASGIFGKLSERRRVPPSEQLRAMCDEAFDHACHRCGYASVCWQKEYDLTADTITAMTTALRQCGRVSPAVIPEHLQNRCCQMERILDDVNNGYAAQTAQIAREDKTAVFASDYGLMAKLLSETSAREEASLRYDEEASARLRHGLRQIDFSAETISVYGTRRRLVVARSLDMAHVRMGGDDICAVTEKLLGCPLSAPEFSISGGAVTMTMRSVPLLTVECGRCSAPGSRTEENGDAVTSFENRDGYAYTLISDGMGSGKEAALVSRVAAVFLERMLTAGAPLETAIEMLHSFLRTGNTECSATVDLMELDLYTGEARFLKSGAAPSFVLRAGKLFRLQSSTVPIGIIKTLDAEMMTFHLRRGDVVVMLSDGVAPSFDEAVWLMDMLCREDEWTSDLRAMAEKIVRRARESSPRPDDATVSLVRIE